MNLLNAKAMTRPPQKRKNTGDGSDNEEVEDVEFDKLNNDGKLKIIFDKLVALEKGTEKNISKLTDEVIELKDNVEYLLAENQSLKREVQFLKQVNVSTSVVFHGLPSVQNVSDQKIVETVAAKLNVNLLETDVVESFRLRSKANTPQPIIVKFVRKSLKQDLLRAAKQKALNTTDLGFNNINNQIAVKEFITKETNELLKYARKLKEKGYKYIWPSGGRVLVKKEEKSTPLVIKDQVHVDALLKLRSHKPSSDG